jgi:hypothetical protein
MNAVPKAARYSRAEAPHLMALAQVLARTCVSEFQEHQALRAKLEASGLRGDSRFWGMLEHRSTRRRERTRARVR